MATEDKDKKRSIGIALGDMIREQRLKEHWTQAQMATLIRSIYGVKISSTVISRYEVGTSNIKLDNLLIIAQFLDIDLNRLAKIAAETHKKY